MHTRFDDSDDEVDGCAPAVPTSGNRAMLPAPGSGPARLGVAASVKADFAAREGECYVYDVVTPHPGLPSTMTLAASLSNWKIKIFNAREMEMAAMGDLTGHEANVNEISFCQPQCPDQLHSASSDCSVRGWDTRNGMQTEQLKPPGRMELWSVSVRENVVAAGGMSEVVFWDRRTRKVVGSFQDAHAEEVTQVRFHPEQPNVFLSASTDGLISVYDMSVGINEDEGFKACLNTGNSVAQLGFFGPTGRRLWCRTHTEGLHLWDWMSACSEEGAEGTGALLAMENFREVSGQAAAAAGIAELANNVDYITGCSYDALSDSLWVKAGNNQGAAAIFPVSQQQGVIGITPPAAVLLGGHSSVVRSLLWPGTGTRCLTAGEDARLCLWDMPSAIPAQSGGASSSHHSGGHHRHQKRADKRHSPY